MNKEPKIVITKESAKIDGRPTEIVVLITNLFTSLNKELPPEVWVKMSHYLHDALDMAPLLAAGMTIEEAYRIVK